MKFTKRIQIISLFVFATIFVKAQDSSNVITHEIGFNTVSLIKQIISNNPTATLPQLPYDIFYNIYYKNQIGVRVGLGLSNSHTETEIISEQAPRTTDQISLNLRAGLSYNFVRSQKITLNVFGDYLLEKVNFETAFTATTQPFQSPVQTITNKTTDKINGAGAEIGVGVKYNIFKHLSIYAEVPIVFMTENSTSEVSTNTDGFVDITTSSAKNSLTRIIIPTTIYLVLRF